jgi:peroxiredoxin
MNRLFLSSLSLILTAGFLSAAEPTKKVEPGSPAPEFKIKGADGKMIDLGELTAKGPVLLRLTCGCSGCDKELAYFQAINEAYKEAGLTCVAVFKEPDDKMVKYAKEKNIKMLYAVDPKGDSWTVFQTKSMPVNFLIEKGGKISHIAAGCDPSGLLAKKVSEKAAKVVNAAPVDVKAKVEEKK